MPSASAVPEETGPPQARRDSDAAAHESTTPYAVLATTFFCLIAGTVALNRRHLPERAPLLDLLVIALASRKLGHVIAEDKVALFVRRPFASGPAAVHPSGTGIRRAIGELLTCAHCSSAWICAGLLAAFLRAPRETRAAASALAAYELSDLTGGRLRVG